jgi:hypothetical protein
MLCYRRGSRRLSATYLLTPWHPVRGFYQANGVLPILYIAPEHPLWEGVVRGYLVFGKGRFGDVLFSGKGRFGDVLLFWIYLVRGVGRPLSTSSEPGCFVFPRVVGGNRSGLFPQGQGEARLVVVFHFSSARMFLGDNYLSPCLYYAASFATICLGFLFVPFRALSFWICLSVFSQVSILL